MRVNPLLRCMEWWFDGGGNGFGAWKLTLQTPEEVSGTLLRVVDGSVVIQSGNNEVTHFETWPER